MEDDFEGIVRSQLLILKNQMDVIKDFINKYDERSMRLKKTITNELISALIGDLSEKIGSINFRFQENLSKSIKDLREEMSETELNKAISKIFEEREIKVSSRALDELKSI